MRWPNKKRVVQIVGINSLVGLVTQFVTFGDRQMDAEKSGGRGGLSEMAKKLSRKGKGKTRKKICFNAYSTPCGYGSILTVTIEGKLGNVQKATTRIRWSFKNMGWDETQQSSKNVRGR